MNKSRLFIIDGVSQLNTLTNLDIYGLVDIENCEYLQEAANKILLNHNEILDMIKRGDIVQFDLITYRNDLKLIWDGTKLIDLEYDIDEYGHVPRQFNMGEFPVNYWDKTISHNYIRWPTENIANQIQKNFTINNDHPEYGCPWYSSFVINGFDKYIVRPCDNDTDNILKDSGNEMNSDKCKYTSFWLDSYDHDQGRQNHVLFNLIRS